MKTSRSLNMLTDQTICRTSQAIRQKIILRVQAYNGEIFSICAIFDNKQNELTSYFPTETFPS